jgi:hypothetical protein
LNSSLFKDFKDDKTNKISYKGVELQQLCSVGTKGNKNLVELTVNDKTLNSNVYLQPDM